MILDSVLRSFKGAGNRWARIKLANDAFLDYDSSIYSATQKEKGQILKRYTLCMCVCVCVCVYTYICVCICIYISPQLKNGIIAPFCHISILGFAKFRLIHCCFLFSKGHTLCLVIVKSSINVFNKLISFFLLWSILLPYRLSSVFIQLHSCFYLFLHLCFINLQPVFYWICGNQECIWLAKHNFNSTPWLDHA